jgi:signal transduction histidine kinase
MESLALYVLLFISQSLNVQTTAPPNSSWTVTTNWELRNKSWFYEAETKSIQSECSDENLFLYLPQIIHGVHSVYADNKLVYQSGDPTLKEASPFYKNPVISCKLLHNASNVRWEIVSYSRYFSRFNIWPRVAAYQLKNNFFDIYLNIMSSAALGIIATLFIIIFYRKVRNNLIFPFFFSALLLSIYFLMCSYSPFSMIISHKIADICLISGVFFLLKSFHSEKLISEAVFKVFFYTAIFSIGIIIVGTNGDVVQLGTTFSVFLFIVCSVNIIYKIIKAILKKGNSKFLYLELSTIVSFLIFGNNDALHIIGLVNSQMLLPLGSVCGLSFLILAINQEVVQTYDERDHLLVNLEEKVIEKTKYLNETLEKLKSTQAELIHSAKLASLGTLSAGIAHEINNAINYVNGAIQPLERQLATGITDPAKKEKIEKLFSVMKDGVNLTVDIIKSLRNYTGLNQAKKNDVDIAVTLHSVLVILKNRLRDKIETEITIDPGLTVFGNVVGLNQIFMNLMTNSIDAMEKGGTLKIQAKKIGDNAVIEISDTGNGIPEEIKSRIFDPFFTTKDVGDGTGLGLHIVQKEVEKHSGTIKLVSELGKGTTFIISLPMNMHTSELGEKAA